MSRIDPKVAAEFLGLLAAGDDEGGTLVVGRHKADGSFEVVASMRGSGAVRMARAINFARAVADGSAQSSAQEKEWVASNNFSAPRPTYKVILIGSDGEKVGEYELPPGDETNRERR